MKDQKTIFLATQRDKVEVKQSIPQRKVQQFVSLGPGWFRQGMPFEPRTIQS